MRGLKSMIAPSFYCLHNDIKRGLHTHYWLKGGRGSGKSSFVSIELIHGMMNDKNANAVVLRKVGATLKDSVYAQLLWAIDMLGASLLWQAKVSPLELVFIPTGQRILFRGADEPKKLKSTKFSKGYCRFIWYEEAAEFFGMEEIRSINQSLMRGGKRFSVFYSFNPPESLQNWVNRDVAYLRDDTRVHESTFLDVPKDWLGEAFVMEAEHLKAVNPERFEHEYMGKATGTGGEVFKNITLRAITDEEIASFDKVVRGLDWGYAADPLHYAVSHFDSRRRRLYIFFEIHRRGLSNFDAARLIKEENGDNEIVICDSAEPKSIAEVNGYGVRCIGAKKGPDSVRSGIKFLQDLEEIVIDPVRCPETAREFTGYELAKDREGRFLSVFPDRDNHSIDAVRYSLWLGAREKKEEKKSPFGKKGTGRVVI